MTNLHGAFGNLLDRCSILVNYGVAKDDTQESRASLRGAEAFKSFASERDIHAKYGADIAWGYGGKSHAKSKALKLVCLSMRCCACYVP